MRATTLRWTRHVGLLLAALLLALLAWRAWDSRQGLPLMPWHTEVPSDLGARAIAELDWAGYTAAEAALFESLHATLEADLPEAARTAANRYWRGSPMYPRPGQADWNRSYWLEPDGEPRGAVVLLHGLTDSPYSLRHLARHYRERGFVAIGIRLPGHGSVPAGLTEASWEDWRAASRLAMRTARARLGDDRPVHLVGYSNGAALALLHALDALEDPALPRAERVVLLSPMVGVTAMARFAGVLGWPAVFPAFARASWIDLLPEYNPYKYNSFPVNGARQSSQLTRHLQARIAAAATAGRLADLPPVLALQSVVDATVSSRAVVDALFARLPANGSELVLIDYDRSAHIEALLREAAFEPAEQLLPPPPRSYHASVLSNRERADAALVERRTVAGERAETLRPLGQRFPHGVYSLSHVALPFPCSDGLYGLAPADDHSRGLQLGALSVRGERGMLQVSPADLARMSCNPFFAYLLERIDAGLPAIDLAPAASP